jgi:hypothetical protein
MDEREIIAALSGSADAAPTRTDACLEARSLAGYLDGALCDTERAAVEAHLADCGFCLRQLAVLIRSAEGTDVPGLPVAVLARAERLAVQPVHRRHARFQWAAAAVVVLALGLFANQWLPKGPAIGEPPRQTRYADQQALQPRLIAPDEGSVIEPLQQVFQWTQVPGSLFYDVRLVSPDGDLLLRERVESTRWLIPDHLRLEPGQEYFVRIDAYLSDAKYLSSEHRVFSVSGTQ